MNQDNIQPSIPEALVIENFTVPDTNETDQDQNSPETPIIDYSEICQPLNLQTRQFYLENLQNPQTLPNHPLPQNKKRKPPVKIFDSYPWLVFDSNGLWCIYCMLFRDNYGSSNSFCNVPFTAFNKVYGETEHNYLLQHHNSLEHTKSASLKVEHDKLIANPARDIQNVTKKLSQEEANKYIKGIKLVFNSLIFLVKQGMPIRGHDESSKSKNKGNLLELIDFIATVSPDLSYYMENCNQNAKYTSPEIQNEIITLTSDYISKEIVSRANSSPGYCIIFDETTDRSNISEICLTLKYIYNGQVEERFLMFIDAYKEAEAFGSISITGAILAEIIHSNLKKVGLNLNKLIGISTDTCATMTSSNCGAFVSLKQKIPHLVHLLCLNHSSNLSLLMSFKSSSDVILAIDLLSDLKSFFRMSPKRDAELRKFLKEKNYSKLLGLCATRWSETHNSVSRILDCYKEVYMTLDSMRKWEDRATSRRANELLMKMESTRTIYSLCTLNWITTRIDPLVKTLQKSTSNHIEGTEAIQAMISSMKIQTKGAYDSVYAKELLSKATGTICYDQCHLKI